MSSSDRTGAQGKAVDAELPVAADDGLDDPDDGTLADPWFAPGPKRAAGAAGGDEPPEWFLPTGRAGLLPDSVTEQWQDGMPPRPDQPETEAAGLPPWGTEPTQAAAGVPPPWETGPWPGPGEAQPRGGRVPTAASSDPVSPATAAFGLRRRPVQLALAAGVGAVVLIVIIVVVVMGSGSPAGGCGTYPTGVRLAYARAMTDLRDNAPVSVQAAAFAQAASQANASAAAAGQIGVRTAMFAVAADLNQAYADVTANRALPTTLLSHLTADRTALPASCPG